MSGEHLHGLRAIALSCSLALTVAGCAGGPKTPPPPPPSPRPPVSVEAALAPADYVREAASISLFAVRASQLVAARNVGLGGLARTVEQEQGGVGSQLSYAGRRLDLLPSAELLPDHAAMLAELDGASDAAGLYRRQMESVLGRGERIHAAFAARGTSPTLRPVATMAAPVFRRELELLRRR